MNNGPRVLLIVQVLLAAIGLALSASPSVLAQTFTVLNSFAGYPTDGATPWAGLVHRRIW